MPEHADVPGRRLAYDRAGDGEPLLLIQGMSGTRLSWGPPFLAALQADGFETIAFDHRGTGGSGRVDKPFTLADLADDAAALLDALALDEAHVLGISMGGMVAQELALRHRDRVRTLTLGCTYAGGPGALLTSPAVWQRIAAAMSSGNPEHALRTMWDVNVSAAFAAGEGNYAAFRSMATVAPVAVPVILLQAQAIGGHDTSARLREIAAPTLVIHGTEDRMLPPVNGELIAAAIPGARLELLDGVGHMFWWEQPERSAELVRKHALARGRAARS